MTYPGCFLCSLHWQRQQRRPRQEPRCALWAPARRGPGGAEVGRGAARGCRARPAGGGGRGGVRAAGAARHAVLRRRRLARAPGRGRQRGRRGGQGRRPGQGRVRPSRAPGHGREPRTPWPPRWRPARLCTPTPIHRTLAPHTRPTAPGRMGERARLHAGMLCCAHASEARARGARRVRRPASRCPLHVAAVRVGHISAGAHAPRAHLHVSAARA